MQATQKYERGIRYIRKTGREWSEDKIIAAVRETFFESLGAVPDPLKRDLYDYYVDAYYDAEPDGEDAEPQEGEGISKRFLTVAEHLATLVDLFDCNYDNTIDPLGPEEWSLVRDLVSEHAGEMDMRVVECIMSEVLSRGLFD